MKSENDIESQRSNWTPDQPVGRRKAARNPQFCRVVAQRTWQTIWFVRRIWLRICYP